MKVHSGARSRGRLKRILLFSLLPIALGAVGACATDEIAKGTDHIIELDQAGTLAGQVDLEDVTLVYPEDTSELLASIRSAPTLSDKRNVISDYLKVQDRIDCILDKIETAATDDVAVSCDGKALVVTDDEHGLVGVHSLWEELQTLESQRAGREFLAAYLQQWNGIRRVDRVVDSLGQMKRTRGIPLFGRLVNTIHQFPIMFEGEELVPTGDTSSLLGDFRALSTEEAQRSLAEDYLSQ